VLGLRPVEGAIDDQRLVDGVLHKLLDGVLAPRLQHVAVEAAAEAFGADESHAVEHQRLDREDRDAAAVQDLADLVRGRALEIVVAEYGDLRDPAGASASASTSASLVKPWSVRSPQSTSTSA
jgi:hypothetical protein